MTTSEIIRSVAFAILPEGACIIVRDNACQGEPTIYVTNVEIALGTHAVLLETHLQDEMRDYSRPTSVFFQNLHVVVRRCMLDTLELEPPGADSQSWIIEWNKKSITRLRKIASELAVEYTVTTPPEPLED